MLMPNFSTNRTQAPKMLYYYLVKYVVFEQSTPSAPPKVSSGCLSISGIETDLKVDLFCLSN